MAPGSPAKSGRRRVVRFFPVILFGFLSIFVIVGVSVAWFVPGMLLFGVFFAGIPILMIIIGAIIFRSIGDGSGDRDEILAFLRRELDARPIV